MKLVSQKLFPFLIILVLGCSSTKEITSNPVTEVNNVIEETNLEPTSEWHLLGTDESPYYGTNVEKAYRELLADKSPKKEVVVAIIDSGSDIDHEDLKVNIWINEDEIAGNGIDDDNNGYIDDINGWNFIGGPDGEHVNQDTYELTRIYADLELDFIGVDPTTIPDSLKDDYEYYLEIKKAFEEKKNESTQILYNLKGIEQAIIGSKQIFGVSSLDSLTEEQSKPKSSDGPYLQQAKQLVAFLNDNSLTENDIDEALEQYESLVEYSLNTEFDPRYIVGDDYDDLSDRFYGNNDAKGVRYNHGTHVAGIVGAVRNNNIGIDGIVNVKLMIVRNTPNGDERDKDVANGIRYAAENGADVINMSFGKGYSPQKEYVDAAVKYADSLGVLMVHGAGNDATNIDSTDSFPNKYYLYGGQANAFMNVGASSWKSGEFIVADFSNYGKINVDIFAPGVDINSTYPDNSYKKEDGTSMASPVVAGIAALIMSYYPELTAVQVKQLLMDTAVKPDAEMVVKPGSDQLVPFSSLSVSGGIIDAYEALLKANELTKGN